MTSFGKALETLTRASLRPGPDRRRWRRVDMQLSGRMLGADGKEADLRTVDLSCGGARIDTTGLLVEGAQTVLYLDKIGRLPATVIRAESHGRWALRLEATATKRERIVEELTWLLNASPLQLKEERRITRHAGKGGQAEIEFDDGVRMPAEVVDFSLVGMAVKCARRPDIGQWVRVGATHGRVSRYVDGGFAVDFEGRPRR